MTNIPLCNTCQVKLSDIHLQNVGSEGLFLYVVCLTVINSNLPEVFIYLSENKFLFLSARLVLISSKCRNNKLLSEQYRETIYLIQ